MTSDDAHIIKVLNSFNALDSVLQRARCIIETQEMSNPHLMLRLEKYEEILRKQREVAKSLRLHLKNKNWVAVCKDIRVMKGLSLMIHDDALNLVYEIQGARIVHISNRVM